jgi:transcriptional regulator with XRE-family HTH domain
MLIKELENARKAAGWSQQTLAERAGLSRMTVQRIESGQIDPRLSTLLEMARALGLELMPVPAELRPQLEDFVRSGGRVLGQPAGVGAPPSIAQSLEKP